MTAKSKIRNCSTVLLVSFGVVLAACNTTHHLVSSTSYPPRRFQDVEPLFQEPSRPYEVIGFVETKAMTIFDKPEGFIEDCRKEAGKIGADAVIFNTVSKVGMGSGGASGRAIRWK